MLYVCHDTPGPSSLELLGSCKGQYLSSAIGALLLLYPKSLFVAPIHVIIMFLFVRGVISTSEHIVAVRGSIVSLWKTETSELGLLSYGSKHTGNLRTYVTNLRFEFLDPKPSEHDYVVMKDLKCLFLKISSQ